MDKKITEAKIEKVVCDYSERRRWWALKLAAPGASGFPDRTFLSKGHVFFIEFKRPGFEPRRLQKFIHTKLRKLGFDVYVVDDIEEGKRIIDAKTRSIT